MPYSIAKNGLDWFMAPSLIFRLSGRCNLKCVFCLHEEPFEGLTVEEAKRQLDKYVLERNVKSVDFMYNETLIHKGFAQIVEHCARIGVIPGVATNGLRLADEGFLADIIAKGLRFMEVSIHAADEKTAASISNVRNTFKLQQKALENLAKHIGDLSMITFNTVICANNSGDVLRIVKYIDSYFDEGSYDKIIFKLKFMNILGRAAAAPDISCKYSDVDYRSALDWLEKRGRIYFTENIPLCVLQGHEHSSQFAIDRILNKVYVFTGYEGRDDAVVEQARRYCPRGKIENGKLACQLLPLCKGPEQKYVNIFGGGEFSPPERKASLIARKILDNFAL